MVGNFMICKGGYRMNEEDIIIIKGVAAMLEHMACTKDDVKYTNEAMGMLAGQLMEVIERNEKDS